MTGARGSLQRVDLSATSGGQCPTLEMPPFEESGQQKGEREEEAGCRSELLRTIEAEIIPRLMLAHRTGRAPAAPPAMAPHRPPNAEEVAEFADLATGPSLQLGRDYVMLLLSAGMPLESIFLDLLAPAARLLGQQWMDDERSFSQVTVGLSRLQQLVHELSSPPSAEVSAPAHERMVVLVPAPGEQHTLGLHIVAELFRKSGWHARTELPASGEDLASLVRGEWVEMVGFSVSNLDLVAPLTDLIKEVRQASTNRNLMVMLGGSLNLEEFGGQVGADLCVTSARDALAFMERHLKEVASRPVN